MKFLIVEDEKRLAQAIAQIMSEQKYFTDVVYTGTDGLFYAQNEQYDAIILDIMLPGMSGIEVAKRLRQEKNSTPILMLTAKDEISDKVEGLDSGADDYMTKPFSPEELLARLRALIRRPGEMILEDIGLGSIDFNKITRVPKDIYLSILIII